ncbi:MAG: helical backbone metal receptor [Anaerolineales bacterium]|nr:helical backbone metal receptor [Anaerolineales bacterium]
MTRKLVLLLTVLTLAVGACAPMPAPVTQAPVSSPTESIATQPASAPTATETPAPKVLTFTDDMGRSIELDEPAKKIVTLGASSLESLFAIGAGEQIVGREEYSTYPEEALAIPSIGSLWGELPAEAILALEPDLVIAPEIISPEQVQALADLGLTVYFQANPVDFEGLWENMRALAALSGHADEAEALIAELDARVQTVNEAVQPLSSQPTVFYELDATDPQNPYTIGGGTFINTLITMAGGYNIGQVLEGDYTQISAEEIISQDPQIIVLGDAPYGVTAETVATRAGWETLSAVQNGNVYEFDPYLVSVPGPRLVDGLEALLKIFHPGLLK